VCWVWPDGQATRAKTKIGYSVAVDGEFLFLHRQFSQPAKKYGVCYEQQRAIVTRPVFERTA
jgi:hypothetical protein